MVDAVFGIILLFIILGVAIGTIQHFSTTWRLLALVGITGRYTDLIAYVLTLYVFIESFRSLIAYFSTRKSRPAFILDAAIVFVIREILIALFKHELEPERLYASSAFIVLLGALRIGSVLV